MTNILEKIKAYKLTETAEAESILPLSHIVHITKYQTPPRGFLRALQEKRKAKQYGLIAEIKKASPSKGVIRKDFNVHNLATAYEMGGATCLSVLTDTPSFMGYDAYLEMAREATPLPCLRKDFMFTPYQIIRSRSIGADCVLLIMACLDNEQAMELEKIAFDYGMDVLIEVHNEDELLRALTYLKSDLIGINNRDLKSFETDIAVTEQLISLIPKEKLVVSESGLVTQVDLQRMKECGVTSFLIGESLMRQADVMQATRSLLGREA